MIAYAASGAAPSGWLKCDGSAVSRSTYSSLFSAISTSFGNGDGSTTFNIPDMRGRIPIGAGQGSGVSIEGTGAITGGSSTTNFSIGATGGSTTTALSLSQVSSPAHAHVLTENPHTHTVSDTNHSHNIRYTTINTTTGQYSLYTLDANGPSYNSTANSANSITVNTTNPKTAGTNVSTAFSINSIAAVNPVAHTNLQPTLVVGAYLIKT